jgi:dipeptidyl aminopeptidase/acylaminoacyl peptidase
MRIYSAFLLLFVCLPTVIHAQKPPIDSTVLGKWPTVGQARISDDGKYCMYNIDDKLTNTQHLTVIATRSMKKIDLTDILPDKMEFSSDSRRAYFLSQHAGLGIITLSTLSVKYIPKVTWFDLLGDKNETLAFQTSDSANNFATEDIRTGERLVFSNIIQYFVSKDKKALLLQKTYDSNSTRYQTLIWIDIISKKASPIWKGRNPHNFTFDNSSLQLAFLAPDSLESTRSNALFYYRAGFQKAINLLQDLSPALAFHRNVPETKLIFSKKGDKLLFQTKEATENKTSPKKGYQKLTVWNYKDIYPQSAQLSPNFSHNAQMFWSVCDLISKKIFDVTDGSETVLLDRNSFQNYLLVLGPDIPDDYYKPEHLPTLSVVSTTDETRHIVDKHKLLKSYILSPNEHFVVWFDEDSLSYRSLDLNTGLRTNLSALIPCSLYDDEEVALGRRSATFDVAGWSVDGHSIFIYDKYDIWRIDLTKNTSINITNGFGRKQNTVFSIAIPAVPYPAEIDDSKMILLAGFNPTTKFNGFWKLNPSHVADPANGQMGPYVYCIPRAGRRGSVDFPHGQVPIKAKKADEYIIARSNTREFPNLYATSDFRTLTQISNIHPEAKYNWLTSELINWKMSDGKLSQGVLYKPENFDSSKKYPLIFNYYEKKSDNLNNYFEPKYSKDDIDIPYYVSNGYLVFLPDIYYQPRHNAQGTVTSVASAAKYLSGFAWVDSTKMAIQGHSFGGWQTNVLVTHTHLFAAACTHAGAADLVSGYDQTQNDFPDRQRFYETASQGSPYGKDVTPWSCPEVYIENSPLFFVQNVSAPLLLVHGTKDGSVPFLQAIEMYLAMKRAGKKVWLLQYDDSDHSFFHEDRVDYTIRMKQFFDHYLKDAPAPKWMTHGIPAVEKGKDDGLDLDLPGVQP